MPLIIASQTQMTTPLQITLQAKDGYPLAATHYVAPGEQFIVMASATGVPARFLQTIR